MLLQLYHLFFLILAIHACQCWDYYYHVVSLPSSKCVDVDGVSMENNGGVSIWDCLPVDNEMWQKVYTTPQVLNPFMLKAKHSGKCLNVADVNESVNGDLVVQYDCVSGGHPNQLWKFVKQQPDIGTIVNQASGKCLTVNGALTSNGAHLDVWDCVGAQHQVWKMQLDEKDDDE